MYSWLEIEELPRQEDRWLTPMQPKMVGGKRHEHGPHSKIDPTVVMQVSHAGIDHRKASCTRLPCLETFVIELIFPKTIVKSA